MAGATPDDAPKQTINEKLCDGTILIGYGKRGHGMNGKDADLDRIGQCCVTQLVTEDPVGADTMRVAIHLRLYASICAPSYDGIDFAALHEWWSDGIKKFFNDHHKVDIEKIDWENWDAPETDKACDTIVEHFREQATLIVCGMDPCPGDPFAFMWDGDGAWDGGTDVVLHVPLTVDEYDAIESGDEGTLDTVAQRIDTEICEANKGGTPERDRLKRFEEEVGLCNDLINKLECYRPIENEPQIPTMENGIPPSVREPFRFHKTSEVKPAPDLHPSGNNVFLLIRGKDVGCRTDCPYDIATYDASDDTWWTESGCELSDHAPEEWAYLEPWPVTQTPT